jgi:1,4-dihydroxy-2-naphthoyl-CoA hydrolase
MTDWTLEELNRIGEGNLPGLLGVEILEVAEGLIRSRLEVQPKHHAPNGYLHAATVIALADTSCGYACRRSLPEGSSGFTTLELKANFLGTVHKGGIACEGRLVHGGRSTQVWDATVSAEATGKVIALFRCTQLVLWPRP